MERPKQGSGTFARDLGEPNKGATFSTAMVLAWHASQDANRGQMGAGKRRRARGG